jgi:hypothetical protein
MKWRAALLVAGMIFSIGCDRLSSFKKAANSTAAASSPSGSPSATATPAQAQNMAGELELDYAILLEEHGQPRRITEKHQFHSGDRFRIEVRPAFDAHLYLLNRGSAQDHYSRLFPNSKVAVENPLPARRVVTLPSDRDWYTLDSPQGVENVVLVAAAYAPAELNMPEESMAREEVENRLALLERDYRPSSSRRFEDRDWVKLFASKDAKTVMLLRIPLEHR